eukprot:350542-Chlamydomonas_euryale.AAC.5
MEAHAFFSAACTDPVCLSRRPATRASRAVVREMCRRVQPSAKMCRHVRCRHTLALRCDAVTSPDAHVHTVCKRGVHPAAVPAR